ncbi:MAG TPA: hypothetical protein DCX46_01165 [Bacteroidetes bacterium]|nr:hypothetical protein [Bacteroidota bacterium]
MPRKSILFICLQAIFLYLFFVAGCSEPQDLVTATHVTRVPEVQNLQGSVGFTSSGKRLILVTWLYDPRNANIRSWDLTRSINDTSVASYVPLEIIRKPTAGFPSYQDTSGSLQNSSFTADSLDVYYKIIPNGTDNFVGKPSDVLHVIIRKNQ